MPTVSVPQANPNDEITAASVNQGPNALATVVNGNLDDTNIASLSGTKIAAGTTPASAMTTAANPETRMNETLSPFVASGLVWSIVSGLNGSMTAGVAYVDGKRLTVSAISSNTFTASKDTYVYITNTGSVSYNAQTNGANQPATPASTVLLAKVVTNASAITSVTAMPGKPVSTSSSYFYWEEIGRSTLTSASNTLSVSFPAKKYLQVMISYDATATSSDGTLRFNSVSTATYSYTSIYNNAGTIAADSQTNQTQITGEAFTILGRNFTVLTILNDSTANKVVNGQSNNSGVSGAVVPYQIFATWRATGTQITSIQLLNGSTTFVAGSEIVVLGHD